MSTVLHSEEVQASALEFRPPFKTPESVYQSDAALAGGPVLLQLPALPVAGVQLDPAAGKAFVELRVVDERLYQLLRAVDDHVVKHIFANRATWFRGVDVGLATVEDYYRSPLVRGDGGPTMRFKLNADARGTHTRAYFGQAPAELADVVAADCVTAIVQLRGLTLYKDAICPDWVLQAVRARAPRPAPVARPLFESDDEREETAETREDSAGAGEDQAEVGADPAVA